MTTQFHIKAYRMNIGDNLAELVLQYGADDIDGTVQQELIMHLAHLALLLSPRQKQTFA